MVEVPKAEKDVKMSFGWRSVRTLDDIISRHDYIVSFVLVSRYADTLTRVNTFRVMNTYSVVSEPMTVRHIYDPECLLDAQRVRRLYSFLVNVFHPSVCFVQNNTSLLAFALILHTCSEVDFYSIVCKTRCFFFYKSILLRIQK